MNFEIKLNENDEREIQRLILSHQQNNPDISDEDLAAYTEEVRRGVLESKEAGFYEGVSKGQMLLKLTKEFSEQHIKDYEAMLDRASIGNKEILLDMFRLCAFTSFASAVQLLMQYDNGMTNYDELREFLKTLKLPKQAQ